MNYLNTFNLNFPRLFHFFPFGLIFERCLGDNNKNNSPFNNKWKTPDKRKTVDDSYANAPIPRLVPLRGSDFTGLGIELCGGLKDGIFVKKVMPQGPAANIVHRGEWMK